MRFLSPRLLLCALPLAAALGACPGDDPAPGAAVAPVADAAAADLAHPQLDAAADAPPDAPTDVAPDAARVVPLRPRDDVLRLNHLQVVGTHNSYHVLDGAAALAEYDYWEDPLDVQLADQGVRQFELDVHWHPDPGRFEVYHVPMVDEGTSCRVFTDCLALIRHWSEANPGHAPLFVFIEPKDDMAQIAAATGTLDAIDEGLVAGHYDDLDGEIREALPPSLRLEPDAVRGPHATLKQALAADGWPTLGAVRGRIAFVMLDGGEHHEAYTYGRTSLDGRAMFVLAPIDAPYAAFVGLDDPVGGAPSVAAAVAAGLMVRTRSDSCCDEALANDSARLTAALTGGAHMISTDWVRPHPDTGYQVSIPGGQPAGCNPVTAPAPCQASDIESLLLAP